MKPGEAISDIKSFIEGLQLQSDGIVSSNKDARTLYRRFHALLIWHHLSDRDEFSDQTRMYAHECVSDASAAYFLTSIGIYKAARISLRSSIENIYRVVISEAGDVVTDYDTVPALLKRAKEVGRTANQKNRLDRLYASYGNLCLTVHSVGQEFMSLRVPFERMMDYDPGAASGNFNTMSEVFREMNDVMFIEMAHHLKLIDFKNADLLRDAVAAAIKGEASAIQLR